jgi:hypothetical protein
MSTSSHHSRKPVGVLDSAGLIKARRVVSSPTPRREAVRTEDLSEPPPAAGHPRR